MPIPGLTGIPRSRDDGTWRRVRVRSTNYAEPTAATIAAWQGTNGQQGGDPTELAAPLLTIDELDNPPLHWVAGADAVAAVEAKAKNRLAQIDAHRELSSTADQGSSG